MSKKPASMPVFGDAYLADTTHLTTEEHGAYWLLLLAAWRQEDCSLPNDDRKLARIAGLTPRKWKSIKPTILEFWTVEDGRIFQARQRKERAFVDQKSEQNRQAANARWGGQTTENKQSGECERISERNAPPPPPPIEEPNGSSSPLPPVKHSTGKGWPSIPDWIPIEPWNGFVDMRRRKGASPTPRAITLVLSELEKLREAGDDPGAVLDQSTERNWTTVYPLKDRGSHDRRPQPPRDNRDGFTRAIDDELARHADARRAAEATG